MKYFNPFSIILFAFISINCASIKATDDLKKQLGNNDDVYGKWHIINFVSMPISALTDEEIIKLKNRIIAFEEKSAIMFNDTCSMPIYKRSTKSTSAFLSKEIRLSPKDLDITVDSLDLIDLRCNVAPKYFDNDSPEFNYYVFTDRKKLFIKYQGVIFILEKEKDSKTGNNPLYPKN